MIRVHCRLGARVEAQAVEDATPVDADSVQPRASFLPRSCMVRPAADISKWFTGGTTACEARLESSRRTVTRTGPFGSSARNTRAFGSRSPRPFTPLKTLSARPSQNCRWLNTALITVGVLRGSTRRVLRDPTRKPSGSGSERVRFAGPWVTPRNRELRTPCEDTISLLKGKKGKSVRELRSDRGSCKTSRRDQARLSV